MKAIAAIAWLLGLFLLPRAFALPNSGYINSFSESGLNFLISLVDGRVTSYPRGPSNLTVTTSLYDVGRVLILDGHDPERKRILFLSSLSVEVYRENSATSQTVFAETLPLPQAVDCPTRYLLKSSFIDSGDFFVSYHGDCHPTRFQYSDQTFTMTHDARRLPGPNIVVGTRSEYDIYVYFEEMVRVKVVSVGGEFSTSVSIRSIGECFTGNTLYPLTPLVDNVAVFALNCSTASGTIKMYHVQYEYWFGSDVTVNEITPGIPVGDEQGRYCAVRQDNTITIYSSNELRGGIPGSRPLTGPISQIIFHEFQSSQWVSVFIENRNVLLVDVAQFISSRGSEGVYEQPNTNISLCDPVCLPQMAIEDCLVVSTYSPDQHKYGFVGLSLTTGSSPQEVFRVEAIPGRPVYSVFVSDPAGMVTGSPVTMVTTPPITMVTAPPVTIATPPHLDPPMLDAETVVPSIVVPIMVVSSVLLFVLVIVALVYRNISNKRHKLLIRKNVDPELNKLDLELNKLDPELNKPDPELKKTDPELKTTDPELKTLDPDFDTPDPENTTGLARDGIPISVNLTGLQGAKPIQTAGGIPLDAKTDVLETTPIPIPDDSDTETSVNDVTLPIQATPDCSKESVGPEHPSSQVIAATNLS